MKNFLLGLIPCIYACQNNTFSTGISCEEYGKYKPWSSEEDALLIELVRIHGEHWTTIAAQIPERNSKQCHDRWSCHLDPKIDRDPWTEEEDKLLLEKVKEFGPHWSFIEQFFVKDTGVRRPYTTLHARWRFLQRAKTQKAKIWTDEDDELLKNLVKQYGTLNWVKIAEQMPGHNVMSCRNRWNKRISADKKHWTIKEDEILKEVYTQKASPSSEDFAPLLHNRTVQACRKRWSNHLRQTLQEDTHDDVDRQPETPSLIPDLGCPIDERLPCEEYLVCEEKPLLLEPFHWQIEEIEPSLKLLDGQINDKFFE